MYCSNELDQQVLYFQQTGDSTPLIEEYQQFLLNYYHLFVYGNPKFIRNASVYKFLNLYIKKTEEDYVNMRTQKEKIDYVIRMLHGRFANYVRNKDLNKDEMYRELLIPFLSIAKKYVQQPDKSFMNYVAGAYHFELYHHIKEMMISVDQQYQIPYDDYYNGNGFEHEEIVESTEEIIIDLDEDLKLNHPDWLTGKKASEPFKSMTTMERLILVKYYNEDYTDKMIGRLVGRNLKSINRVRNRLLTKLENHLEKGELAKWMGFKKSSESVS